MSLSATTRVAAVIGTPIRHSLSPAIYNAAYAALGLDWVFVAFDVAPGNAGAAVEAVRTLGLVGLSVTMPHKADAAAACDDLTPDAAALGAVNTVHLDENGRLLGDSTDGEGFRRALLDAGHDPAGRRVVVLGAGGAARAVVLTLGRVGGSVTVAARRPAAAQTAAALAPGARAVSFDAVENEIAAADIVVQATSIGMAGDDRLPFDAACLRPGLVVAELVYHPRETPLLAAARARGADGVDGLGMLVAQAGLQVERWTGSPAPLAVMANAAAEALAGR
ncbi:MAG: shikimate dehydrogenase [Actinomycetia bacterium]|nr:shikimate dehydrogenase [Actinomycetes bacterium]